jgi:hypothetical protein
MPRLGPSQQPTVANRGAAETGERTAASCSGTVNVQGPRRRSSGARTWGVLGPEGNDSGCDAAPPSGERLLRMENCCACAKIGVTSLPCSIRSRSPPSRSPAPPSGSDLLETICCCSTPVIARGTRRPLHHCIEYSVTVARRPSGKTPCQSLDAKTFLFTEFRICRINGSSRPPQGAFRDRHETRAGRRWPRRRRRAGQAAGRESP